MSNSSGFLNWPNQDGYDAIKQAAQSLGLPTSFKNDLEFHDLKFLQGFDKPINFIWHVRNTGTDIINISGPMDETKRKRIMGLIDTIEFNWSDGHWFMWFDGKLIDFTGRFGPFRRRVDSELTDHIGVNIPPSYWW